MFPQTGFKTEFKVGLVDDWFYDSQLICRNISATTARTAQKLQPYSVGHTGGKSQQPICAGNPVWSRRIYKITPGKVIFALSHGQSGGPPRNSY